ncbi:pyridoxal phosphate-dependent aminotransferase [Oharaeibacter diazotrophicus]|uniref:Aminotransferase n=1 Tax=Oharaeibacter diazotrophicus TaxID=1920512 RepID=A0A4R6RE21_9HYPH|nr:pyridoxal phosphate-dependent aminotransferase [Oharaeibacter diazotrophicus]TDP83977.1 aspartate/methionine/tyrosine aminotransferase [Oharaeibacter diazotrophicus]BBE73016.1 aspartate aminotransferase [Pleomorphomonas sp. SM30]GLS74804.1 aminotransferase [Oharaeibacter diazotrophicus]
MSSKPAPTHPANHPERDPLTGIRPQIQDLRTENIAALAVRAQEVGGVIPLWYGEGDIVTPAFIRDAAKASLDAGETFYIPNMRGAAPLVEALSAYQSGLFGRPIAPDRSTVAPGGMQALLMALELLVDLGTNVVYVSPQWPNIHNAIHLVGGEPRPVPLGFDDDFRLDLDRLFAACDARTRAIFLSTPSNPTGWTATEEELRALLDFSRRTGVWIISDEVYNRLYFAGRSAPSMLEIAEDGDRVITINSFSKAWAMTGWRVGWLTHPSRIAPQVAAMTQYVNSGTAGFAQAGAAAALTRGEGLVEEIRTRVRDGLDLAYDRLARIPGVRLPVKPRGGMYAFFRLDGEEDSAAACRRIIEEARVGLSPGYLFGATSRAFLRMCVFRETGELAVALDRMVGALGGGSRPGDR